MTLQLVTPPAVLPLSFFEVKRQARIEGDVDDQLTQVLIETAVAKVDARGDLGRAMITQTWAQWVPGGCGAVRLVMGPFQSLTAVEYYDADGVLQTAELTDYEVLLSGDFVVVRPKSGKSWPQAQNRDDAIKLTYDAGYGDAASDVPRDIRQAMMMLIAHMYENREAVTEVKLVKAPMGYDDLLNNHRVSWFG